jgi:hypothetical protein
MTIKLTEFLGYKLGHFGLSGHFGEVFSIHYQVTVITKYTFNDGEVHLPITARDRKVLSSLCPTFVPNVLESSKFFYSPMNAQVIVLKNNILLLLLPS